MKTHGSTHALQSVVFGKSRDPGHVIYQSTQKDGFAIEKNKVTLPVVTEHSPGPMNVLYIHSFIITDVICFLLYFSAMSNYYKIFSSPCTVLI